MHTLLRAKARFGSLTTSLWQGLFRRIYGKNWACARYERRHEPLNGPRPGARI